MRPVPFDHSVLEIDPDDAELKKLGNVRGELLIIVAVPAFEIHGDRHLTVVAIPLMTCSARESGRSSPSLYPSAAATDQLLVAIAFAPAPMIALALPASQALYRITGTL